MNIHSKHITYTKLNIHLIIITICTRTYELKVENVCLHPQKLVTNDTESYHVSHNCDNAKLSH